MNPSQEEADILDSLQKDQSCATSHVIPCEVVRSDKVLAIMPYLTAVYILLYPKRIDSALDTFDQLLEVSDEMRMIITINLPTSSHSQGIAYLHDRGVAHMVRFTDLYNTHCFSPDLLLGPMFFQCVRCIRARSLF